MSKLNFVTLQAKIPCKHKTGIVELFTFQDLVKIEGQPVLVENDPQNKPIDGCSNLGPTIKPCTLTMQVKKGYSKFIAIDGRAVCLDSLTGLTDGTPPGMIEFTVDDPGQTFVKGDE